MRTQPHTLLGKYRDLVLAIALFLVIDIGVLAFNYFTSALLEKDTTRINIAGELRMYSQQLAKSVLTLRYELETGQPVQTSLAQISEAQSAFEDSLRHLERELSSANSEFMGSNAGTLAALESLQGLNKYWQPLAIETAALTGMPPSSLQPGIADSAASMATARNVKIMQLAGELTEMLERSTRERASAMRQIQLLAIVLALLNFVFIVFKFVRSLRRSDRAAEIARDETGRILATVQEGLVLIDRQGRIGQQQSASLAGLFGAALPAGNRFLDVLAPRIAAENLESAGNYIDLLFNQRVKPALLRQLNPLQEIAFARDDNQECYLDFEFVQVRSGDQVDYLLVSVFDITERVVLQRQLVAAETRAKSETDALLAVLDQDPHQIDVFLRTTEARLAEINLALAGVDARPEAYLKLIRKTARTIHGIKGEAAVLNLRAVEQSIHDFESALAPLLQRRDLNGDDLIPIAVALNDVHENTAKIWRVIGRVRHYAEGKPEDPATARNELRELLAQIEHMTLRVAEDLNKKARLQVSTPSGIRLPEHALSFLRTTLPQLVRNAIAHGIESAEERLKKGKPLEGTIHCAVDVADDGALTVQIQDDGAGLAPAKLRAAMLAKGLISAREAERMSDQEVVSRMFEPGFSQQDDVNLHAGRGEGLAVVREAIAAVGARMRISSRPERYTRFTIRLEKEHWQCV